MLSIIILNYNDTHHTINCLNSLQNQNYKDFEIIIIENNSDEFYKKQLNTFLKRNQNNKFFLEKINLIQVEENLGFMGGCNLGIRKSKGDLILLLNNDTYHESKFLESMVNFFKKYKNLHIAQPKICFYPDKHIIYCNGGKINKFSFILFRSLNYKEKDNDLIKKPFRVDYAAGTAFFIRRDILKKIGLLDDIYFMYCDESDLCYRATLKGYGNIYCNPATKIYHNTQYGSSELLKKYYFRNRMIFCLKHFSFALIIWQFFMQLIQLFINVIDLKKKKINYDFFFKSIIGMINGFKIGILRRLKIHEKKIRS